MKIKNKMFDGNSFSVMMHGLRYKSTNLAGQQKLNQSKEEELLL